MFGHRDWLVCFFTFADKMAFAATSRMSPESIRHLVRRHFRLERHIGVFVRELRGRLDMPGCLMVWSMSLKLLRETRWHHSHVNANETLIAKAVIACATSASSLSSDEDTLVRRKFVLGMTKKQRQEFGRMQSLTMSDVGADIQIDF